MNKASGYVLLRAIVVAAFLLLIGRLWYMQIVQVNAYRAQGVQHKLQVRIVPAPRGIIYDRNGVPLVRNLPRLDVTVWPDEWGAAHSIRESRLLSRLLHHVPDPSRIRAIVDKAAVYDPSRAVIIKANLNLTTFYTVRSFADQLPGVEASKNLSHRVYLDSAPYPLAHILGYVGDITPALVKADDVYTGGPWAWQRYTGLDTVGLAGIESVFDHELHGVNGVESSQIDALGNQVTPWRTASPTIPGAGVKLTIDSRFEKQVANTLHAGLQKLGVIQGSAVVMNPNNGQVLAMVSLPSYNANIYTAAPSVKQNKKIYRLDTNPARPLFDVSTGGQLAPGSIYKIITATAGLESGVITPSTIVNDNGVLQRCPPPCIAFHGWAPNGLGAMDIVHAIARSSDIFFYEVAGGGPDIAGQGLGPRRLGHWARKYGLGKPTGIELPNENGGLVPTPRYLMATQGRTWSYGDSYNMGIGQGLDLVTPLQMARMASVIANGGSLVRPTIIDAITGPNGRRILHGRNYGLVPDIVRPHFVARWVTSLIGQGMRLGVTWGSPGNPLGTSYGQVDPRTRAAGKTGTAESPQGAAAWWVGFAPYKHPKIAVCVSIPTANAEGAYAAAPIASKIILDYFHILAPNWLQKVQKILLNPLGSQ